MNVNKKIWKYFIPFKTACFAASIHPVAISHKNEKCSLLIIKMNKMHITAPETISTCTIITSYICGILS